MPWDILECLLRTTRVDILNNRPPTPRLGYLANTGYEPS
jgi:hypothetical protein